MTSCRQLNTSLMIEFRDLLYQESLPQLLSLLYPHFNPLYLREYTKSIIYYITYMFICKDIL